MSLVNNLEVELCGGLLLGQEFAQVFIRPSTGDVLFEEENGSIMLIGGLTEVHPNVMDNTDNIELALRSFSFGPTVIGVVYTGEHAVFIKANDTAERRPYATMFDESDEVFNIDLNTVDPMSEDEEYED